MRQLLNSTRQRLRPRRRAKARCSVGGLISDTIRDSCKQSAGRVDGVEADPGNAEGTADGKQQQREEPLHETATTQQIEDTPVGTMAHRNYSCPALNTERAAHAPDALRQRAARSAVGNLAFERAIHPSLDHTVPRRRSMPHSPGMSPLPT